ncbi:activator of Hsp90 ATPase [Lanmaoa asiatica]|nr:activator of Hsp90 ATPase [Lanmaoa asiatica]
MSMLSTTANWHWKNKNVTPWAKTWFQEELTQISIQGDGEENIRVTSTSWLEGDAELGQRKSKLITIYDCKISVEWTGTASDGTEVTGKVTIPEVSHEITLDRLSDYTYQWSENGSTNPAVTALCALAKERLPAAFEVKFAEFPVAIIEKHGKDLTVSGEHSRTGTPAPMSAPVAASGSAAPSAPAPAKPATVTKAALNTSKIVKEATFMAAADDLFGLLTDPQRIPSWTRARAESAAKADTPYSLFGGGVKGRYISLTPGKEIVQTWALTSPIWPSEHEATLTTTFEQSSDSTKVTFTLAGVPKGLEDELGRNIDGYYIHGLKSIGYVQLIVSPTYSQARRVPKKSRPPVPEGGDVVDNKAGTAVAIAVAVLAAAFCLPYLSYPPILLRPFAK